MPTVVLMIVFFAARHIGTNAERLDVAVFLDGSSTICDDGTEPCPNWDHVRQFICDLVESLTIGPDNTRVSVVTIGDYAHEEWGFSKHKDKASLCSAIQNLKFGGGELTAEIPLNFFLTNIFPIGAGDRPGVQTIVIGITDGFPHIGNIYAVGIATALQKTGIKIFMICVTTRCPENFAQGLSSSPKQLDVNYFRAKDYDSLGKVKDKLLKQILAS